MRDATGDELALLCEELRELRALASSNGLEEAFDSLTEDVRAGAEVGTRRIELLRQLGVPAGSGLRSIFKPAGLGEGRPTAELYGCPKTRCTRLWVRPPGDPIPTCPVYRKPLSHRPSGS